MVDPETDKGVRSLSEYWFRARSMHELLHGLRAEYEYDIERIHEEGAWWEFEMFLDYWLSALFVVVEGFNKLKLKDAKVLRLFQPHMQYLKGVRHSTYHFVNRKNTIGMVGRLNWAEELHDAIGSFLERYFQERMREEKAAMRKKRASSSLKRKKRKIAS